MVFLKAIGGSGYVTPSKASVRMSGEPCISVAWYLMQRCGGSLVPFESSEQLCSAREIIPSKGLIARYAAFKVIFFKQKAAYDILKRIGN